MKRQSSGYQLLEEVVPREVLLSEVRVWAERMDVKPTRVSIRPMTRKWGSCSTRGSLSFAEDLLWEPAEFRTRVIIEELLHLKVPNHGALFKALLKSYLAMRE